MRKAILALARPRPRQPRILMARSTAPAIVTAASPLPPASSRISVPSLSTLFSPGRAPSSLGARPETSCAFARARAKGRKKTHLLSLSAVYSLSTRAQYLPARTASTRRRAHSRHLPPCAPPGQSHRPARGQVAEWSKARAWKVRRRETVSRVRIPSCPPPSSLKYPDIQGEIVSLSDSSPGTSPTLTVQGPTGLRALGVTPRALCGRDLHRTYFWAGDES